MGKFQCAICELVFSKKGNLLRHLNNLHEFAKREIVGKIRRNCIKCYDCDCTFKTSSSYDMHLKNAHRVQIEVQNFKFTNETEFFQWKEQEEISSKSNYFKMTCARPNSHGDFVGYYFCNRRGIYASKNHGKRMSRAKGTSKIGLSCSARIVAKTNSKDGSVNVSYYSTHVGHNHEFCYLKLPESQERIIATRLAQGVTLDHILDEISDEANLNDIREKKHFINRKNLFNIMQKYNIGGEGKYHQIDEISVDLFIEECAKLEHNPILFFKKQGEMDFSLNVQDIFSPDASIPISVALNKDEFMLIIMTNSQTEVLKKFGSSTILIDSTRNTNPYDVQLTTIVCLDEYGEGFPAAFCLSSKVNATSMTLFFEAVKYRIGTINTRTFMSDDENFYYDAWEKTMSKVHRCLLGKWYVIRAWKGKLNLIPDKKVQSDVYATLEILMEEVDEKKFDALLRAFLQQLKVEKYDDFYNYFRTRYANCASLWASCYQTPAQLETNKAFEALHEVLDHVCPKVQKNRRIDFLINKLFKIIRDKVFSKIINSEDARIARHINNISKRHSAAKNVTDITRISSNEWHVITVRMKNAFYSILQEEESCGCERKCLKCNVCMHMYTCNCFDYLIKHNLCKHIHAVITFQRQEDENENHHQTLDDISPVITFRRQGDKCENVQTSDNNSVISFQRRDKENENENLQTSNDNSVISFQRRGNQNVNLQTSDDDNSVITFQRQDDENEILQTYDTHFEVWNETDSVCEILVETSPYPGGESKKSIVLDKLKRCIQGIEELSDEEFDKKCFNGKIETNLDDILGSIFEDKIIECFAQECENEINTNKQNGPDSIEKKNVNTKCNELKIPTPARRIALKGMLVNYPNVINIGSDQDHTY